MRGSIYKITNDNLNYIGSTSQTINQRLSKHKNNYKNFLNGKYRYCSSFEILKQNEKPFRIEMLEEIEYENRKDLFDLESKYINENNCVNIVYNAVRC